jgi:hypothetical protein
MRTIAASGLIALTAMLGVAASMAVASPATAGQTPATASPARAAKAPPPANQLYGVSCVTSKYCVAVGVNENAELTGGGALVQRWNGKAWSTAAPKLPAGGRAATLLGVSCKSATACVAVGVYLNKGDDNFALAETWNGRAWTPATPPMPVGTVDAQLSQVSCATAKSCVAVGRFNASTVSGTFAESWNGSKWTLSRPPEPKGSVNAVLDAVSCPSATYCIAVGSNDTFTATFALADVWNGKTWARMSITPPASGTFETGLNAIACTSPKSCVVLGAGVGTSNRPGGLTSFGEHWNGKAWTAGTIAWPKGTSNSYLVGVSCGSAASCVAVGQVDLNINDGGHTGKATAASWNGKAWTVRAVPAPAKGHASVLDGVSCLTAANCLAVGQLGPFNSDEGNGLAGFWNGKRWSLAATP